MCRDELDRVHLGTATQYGGRCNCVRLISGAGWFRTGGARCGFQAGEEKACA